MNRFPHATKACSMAMAAALVSSASAQEWVPLFNGKDLDGWRQINGSARFEAKDNTIVGTSVPNSPNSFLCTTKQYGDFELEFQVKVDRELNSGAQIRSESRPDYQNGRVHGYQVEIAVGGFSGGIYDESRRNKFLNTHEPGEEIKTFLKDSEWNQYKVLCQGERIRTWVNGKQVSDIRDSMTARGFIGLQVHGVGKRSDPLQVAWRNIRLREITRVIIFSEDFEGELHRKWGRHGNAPANCALSDGAPRRGSRALRLAGSPIKDAGIAVCYLERVVSTVGYGNIQVSFDFAAEGLEYEEHADFLWNDAGPYASGHWTFPLAIKAGDAQNDGMLRHYSFALTNTADNNPKLTLGFYMWGFGGTNRRAVLDNLVVTGDRAGGARATIFSDDFESGFSGQWARKGPSAANIVWSTEAPTRGARAVHFRGAAHADEEDFDCYTDRTISTLGFRNIQIAFHLGTTLSRGAKEEVFSAYWLGNGTGSDRPRLHRMLAMRGSDAANDNHLHPYSFFASSEADNNPYFTLQFLLNGTSTTDQHGYLDDIVITGEKFSGPNESCAVVVDEKLDTVLDGGVAPHIDLTTPDFGVTDVGKAIDRRYFLHNTGRAAMTVDAVVASGDFTVIAQPAGSVRVGGGKRDGIPFTVRFTPSAAGLRTGVVSFRTTTDNKGGAEANDTLHTFAVRGTGR